MRTRRPEPPPLARHRLSPRDLVAEAITGIVQRPLRAALTCAGTVLGVGALVATLGIATTAGAQIDGRFDALAATEVEVRAEESDERSALLPSDTEARLAQIDGVTASGVTWEVASPGSARRRFGPSAAGHSEEVPVTAASPGALSVMRATIARGRPYDDLMARRGEHVALVGSVAARNLGITDDDIQPSIELGGVLFAVAGIIEDVQRHADALLSIVVSDATAVALWGTPALVTGIIETRPGAAQVVGAQVGLALRPEDPDTLTVVTPGDPRKLRGQVEGDVNSLYVVLGGVSLVIGAIGIANTTLVSVMERTGEIGLRRALGATRRQIATQFLAESAALGLVGGLIGTSLGLGAVALVSALRTWTAVISPVSVVAPLLGALVGLAAGFYPSRRAAAIEPLAALRSQ